MFRSYLFNGYRRLAAQLPYWVIPVGIGECFVMFFLPHLWPTYTAQAIASMRGLRRETLGRTARRATLRARRTSSEMADYRGWNTVIYVDMSSRTNLRERRAGTGQIDVCDYLCWRRNERGMRGSR
jgi:hypothetical protein